MHSDVQVVMEVSARKMHSLLGSGDDGLTSGQRSSTKSREPLNRQSMEKTGSGKMFSYSVVANLPLIMKLYVTLTAI